MSACVLREIDVALLETLGLGLRASAIGDGFQKIGGIGLVEEYYHSTLPPT